ncbi:helix-turn-helix transcriptional regulator [Sphingomonas sp. MMS12-HWE2-04]|uniref:helix-turn-helix domain-containing protein n=1 Tax=Sphingomonas sp. MMS12-HWE2-04 TaxID=3234199 RepID=UPI00384F99F7
MTGDTLAPDAEEEARLRELMRLLRKADERASEEDRPIGEFRIPRSRIPERHLSSIETLTKTEVAVMRFLGWGRANADIATLLAISENTVRVHLNNMCRKLELDGVRELNALAGLFFHPSPKRSD